MTPAFVRCVSNLRGRVLPVVDLLARFDKDVARLARPTGVVVVDVDVTASEGITSLRQLMALLSTPVVACSSLTTMGPRLPCRR